MHASYSAPTSSTGNGRVEGSIGEFLAYVDRSLTPDSGIPNWPPDVFAIVASILQRSSSYPRVLSAQWPPKGRLAEWRKAVTNTGKMWRQEWNHSGSNCAPPSVAQKHWRAILAAWNSGLDEIGEEACVALLNLMAIVDEACFFAGFPAVARGGREEVFSKDALIALRNGKWATLCRAIHGSKVAVLPKCHTPQTGFTLRSLSHNLALCPGSEMRPVWRSVPFSIGARTPAGARPLNLLLVPWPNDIRSSAFQVVNLPWHGIPATHYGYFTYTSGRVSVRTSPTRLIQGLLQAATRLGHEVNGIVFPELALTQTEYDNIRASIAPPAADGRPSVRFLLGGVGEPSRHTKLGKNQLRFDLVLNDGTRVDKFAQSKHHRWQLNKGQMDRYRLDPRFKRSHLYWEAIEIGSRDLNILALDPFLTMVVLICEDLARPDPVGDLVRAVGPNLIIALLADAPQLATRWPGRYAAAFAEDPGSSVLTLTSLGMCLLDATVTANAEKRIVALWSEGGHRPKPIELPLGAGGLVLRLSVDVKEEFSADGRSDHRTAGDVKLIEIVPVTLM